MKKLLIVLGIIAISPILAYVGGFLLAAGWMLVGLAPFYIQRFVAMFGVMFLLIGCSTPQRQPTYTEYLAHQLNQQIQRYPNVQHTCITKPLVDMNGRVVSHHVECY